MQLLILKLPTPSSWLLKGNPTTDARYALRTFVRQPGFAAVAIATIALGVGANTAIFSAINTVLLKPLPFEAPDRLVALWEVSPREPEMSVSYPNFLAGRARANGSTR